MTDLYKNENHTKICFKKELDLSALPSRDRVLANPFASLKGKTNKQTNKVPILEHLATMRRWKMTATVKNVCFPWNFRPRKKLGSTTTLMIQPSRSFSWENTYIWIHILSSTEINSHLVFFDRQQQQHQLLLLLLLIHLPSIANKQNKHHVCLCVKADAA